MKLYPKRLTLSMATMMVLLAASKVFAVPIVVSHKLLPTYSSGDGTTTTTIMTMNHQNSNEHLFSLDVSGLVRQHPFLTSSLYFMTVLAFVPSMIFVCDNYNMFTNNKVRIRNLFIVIIFMSIAAIAVSLGCAFIGVLAYSLGDGIILTYFNKPLAVKLPGIGHCRYIGTLVFHHIGVLTMILLIDGGVIKNLNLDNFVILQFSRVVIRDTCVALYYNNKDKKNPMVSLIVNVAVTLCEITSTAVSISLIGYSGILQLIFVLIDFELSVALHQQRKDILDEMKADRDEPEGINQSSKPFSYQLMMQREDHDD